MALNTEWPDFALEQISLDTRSALVTLTHDPKLDDPALQVALRSPAFYVGALGSKKTQAARIERLQQAGSERPKLPASRRRWDWISAPAHRRDRGIHHGRDHRDAAEVIHRR